MIKKALIAITCLYVFCSSGIVSAQQAPFDVDEVLAPQSGFNIAEMLLLGVESGELDLLWFDTFSGVGQPINLGSVVIFGTDEYPLWDVYGTYYYGDLVSHNGKLYEAISDDLEASPEDDTVGWKLTNEALIQVDMLNNFYLEKEIQGAIKAIHLYSITGPDVNPNYIGSFVAEKARDFLNETHLIHFQLGDHGHLAGNLFLNPPKSFFFTLLDALNATLPEGVDRSDGPIMNYDGLQILRNPAMGSDERIKLIHWDRGWEIGVDEATGILLGNNHRPEFMLLGDALFSGALFGQKIQAVEAPVTEVTTIHSDVLEEFYVLDSATFVDPNGEESLRPVSTSGVSFDEWDDFYGSLIAGVQGGKWNAYTDSNLQTIMDNESLTRRQALFPEEIGFGFDPWDQDTEYYQGDLVDYAGVQYVSNRDENENYEPSQYPEYWDVAQNVNELFDSPLVEIVRVSSKLVISAQGEVISMTPVGFSPAVPGDFFDTGMPNHEIGWFKLEEINIDNPSGAKILKVLRDHGFYASWIYNSPLRMKK